MPINLSKGQKVDLTKKNPGLKKIMVGLGWDVNAFDSGSDFDLDAAAFMLGANGKCPTEKEFIFYGNLKHANESVIHMGDNLTGEGEGDDEQIMIDLSKVPANIERIAFTAFSLPDLLPHSFIDSFILLLFCTVRFLRICILLFGCIRIVCYAGCFRCTVIGLFYALTWHIC